MYSLDTSCKECIFADYVDMRQDCCRTSFMRKFEELGTEIIDAYDEEKEFWVIKGRMCPCYRTENWIHKDEILTRQLIEIKDESKIPYQVIIFANNNIEDVGETLDSLMKQTIPPLHVTIIKTMDCFLPPRPLTELCDQYPSLIKNYRVECIVNPEINRGNAIDFVIDVVPKLYYAVFNAGFTAYPTLFEDINNVIFEELKPLTVVKPNSDGNGEIINYYIHKQYQGNKDFPLIEKIELEHKIPMISEICPNF